MFESVDARTHAHTDARTPARVPSYKLTLWAFGSGELKNFDKLPSFLFKDLFICRGLPASSWPGWTLKITWQRRWDFIHVWVFVLVVRYKSLFGHTHTQACTCTHTRKKITSNLYLSQLMRLWYLSHRRPVKAQASLRIRAVSPEPSLLAHMKYGKVP